MSIYAKIGIYTFIATICLALLGWIITSELIYLKYPIHYFPMITIPYFVKVRKTDLPENFNLWVFLVSTGFIILGIFSEYLFEDVFVMFGEAFNGDFNASLVFLIIGISLIIVLVLGVSIMFYGGFLLMLLNFKYVENDEKVTFIVPLILSLLFTFFSSIPWFYISLFFVILLVEFRLIFRMYVKNN